MFERFTDRSRRVVVLAQEEARLLNHNYIGTEHILLGLIHEGEGVAAKALESLGISLARVRHEVEGIIGEGGSSSSGHIPFTPRAKKVLELSLREALQFGHNYIGTEHVLLGLIREGEGVAAQVLVMLGADLSRVRQQVVQLLSGYSGEAGAGGAESGMRPSMAEPMRHPATRCSFCDRDLWEVDRYVSSAGVAMCEHCVAAASTVVAESAARPPSENPLRLFLPPRVFGTTGHGPTAVEAIQACFATAFDTGADEDERAAALEDGVRLAPLLDEARARFTPAGAIEVHVERVRFTETDQALVRFSILFAGAGFLFDGRAVSDGERWRVSRDTFCEVIGRAGVACPPPD